VSSGTVFATARVNLIGEHTDYNQGLALPFAIAAGVTVSARRAPGRTIEATALDLNAHDRFALPAPPRVTGWRAYVRGAAAELERAGVALPGARLEFSGTVPRGSGLSSSASLEVALCLALLALSDSPRLDRSELAALCMVSQPRMSWHLRILRKAEVIRTRRDGREVFCRLDREAIATHFKSFARLIAVAGVPAELTTSTTPVHEGAS